MEKTLFIAFEGIDGCGKDTQLHRLVETIKEDDDYPFGNKYSNIWVTREPTKITSSGVEIARLIRQRDVSGEEATEFFVKDRKEHSTIIKEMLEHSHVLTSRYDLSTLSYQMSQGMNFDELYEMHEYGKEGGCVIPDITLVFDLTVDEAFNRMSGRNSADECFEKKDFQEKVRENLMFCIDELRKRDGRKIIVVDASKSKEEVTREMIEKIAEFLGK